MGASGIALIVLSWVFVWFSGFFVGYNRKRSLLRKRERAVDDEAEHVFDGPLTMIEKSLLTEPGKWVVLDRYYLRNRERRLTIWIANADYGIEVEMDGQRIYPSRSAAGALLGSSRVSEEVSEKVRVRLWKAVQRCYAMKMGRRMKEKV